MEEIGKLGCMISCYGSLADSLNYNCVDSQTTIKFIGAKRIEMLINYTNKNHLVLYLVSIMLLEMGNKCC